MACIRRVMRFWLCVQVGKVSGARGPPRPVTHACAQIGCSPGQSDGFVHSLHCCGVFRRKVLTGKLVSKVESWVVKMPRGYTAPSYQKSIHKSFKCTPKTKIIEKPTSFQASTFLFQEGFQRLLKVTNAFCFPSVESTPCPPLSVLPHPAPKSEISPNCIFLTT